MISEFGENTNSYCSFESKETALLHSENGNLQQRVNVLTHEVRGVQKGGREGGGEGKDGLSILSLKHTGQDEKPDGTKAFNIFCTNPSLHGGVAELKVNLGRSWWTRGVPN